MNKILKTAVLLFFFVKFAAAFDKVPFETTLSLQTNYEYFNYGKMGVENEALQLYTPEFVSGISVRPELNVTKKLEDCSLFLMAKAKLESGKTSEFTVYKAYADINEGPFSLSIGKQRIKWGTGYMWNPSDVLQKAKYALSPEDDIEGTYNIKVFYSNDIITPMAFIESESASTSAEFSKSLAYAFQLYKLVGTADIFLNAAYRQDYVQSIGAALSWDVDIFVFNAECAAIRYMKDAVNMKCLPDNSECGKLKYSAVTGISKKIGESFYFYAEYLYNGWGFDNDDYQKLADTIAAPSDMAAVMAGMPAWPKKNYAGFNASYTLFDTLTLSAAAVCGPDDGAIYWYPGIIWAPSENYGFEIYYLFNGSGSNDGQGMLINPLRSALECRFNAYF